MTKKFIYCESQEGGMQHWKIDKIEGLKGLYGWMDNDCKKEDTDLVNWSKKAKIGDYFLHRLGICFRVNHT